jgi:hypothetical protein
MRLLPGDELLVNEPFTVEEVAYELADELAVDESVRLGLLCCGEGR